MSPRNGLIVVCLIIVINLVVEEKQCRHEAKQVWVDDAGWVGYASIPGTVSNKL